MPIPTDFLPIAVFLLTGLSAGALVVAVFYPRVAKAGLFHRRLAGIAAMPGSSASPVSADSERRRRSVEETLRELEDKQKAKTRKTTKPSFKSRLRQAGLYWSRQKYYMVCLIAGLVCAVVALAIGAGPVSAAGFGVAGGLLLPHLYVNAKRNGRFKKFEAEFPNALDVIVRGVKSGLPLADCMRIIATEAQDPVRSEFRTIVEDQTLGLPAGEAVERLAERVPISEASFFAIVIAIQSRTGGSLSEALGNLSKVLRERKKMRGKIKAMSSEAKSSAGIIGALPFFVAGAVYLTSPDYISLLFVTTTGKIVLVGCAIWMFIGISVMRKMINFDH